MKLLQLIPRVLKNHNSLLVSLIFVFMVIVVFSPVIFLGQSYNFSRPMNPEFLGYHGKQVSFLTTIDPGADYEQNWPISKLVAKLMSEGNIPLWNPYMGGGAPLAADTDYYTYSPLIFGFLLPMQLWDVILLGALWFAGIFTFIFLRSLGLNQLSSFVGGAFYIFSGGFTWYLPHPSSAIMIFTPLILYSFEKIIQTKDPKNIILLSISLFLSTLGSHLESLVLQFLLIIIYVTYRFSFILLSKHKLSKQLSVTEQSSTIKIKKIILWTMFGILGGLMLAAFFILPVYEFISQGELARDSTTGLAYNHPYVLLTAFVPYAMGQIQSYWNLEMANESHWNTLPGYIGMSALFFSILGIVYSMTLKGTTHRLTPLLFFALAVFFLAKTVGLPVINSIGSLPILNNVVYPRYSSIIIPFGFAVAASFGINSLSNSKINKKILYFVFIISISVVILLSIPYLPYLSDDAKLIHGFSIKDAKHYFGFEVFQAILFALMTLILCLIVSKNNSIIRVIPLFVLLELFLYIPVGLPYVWFAYKSLVVLIGEALIILFLLKPNKVFFRLHKQNELRYPALIIVFLTIIIGGVLVSYISPYGMLERYDTFQQNPLTNFLKENMGNFRMFSFDNSLGPNYPAAYEINTLDSMSAFNIKSFYSFNNNFLARDGTTTLGWPSWRYGDDTLGAITKFIEDKTYFDFLGVKYIVTDGYDFSITPGSPITSSYVWLQPSENNIGESFISPTNDILGISVSFGTALRNNHGTVVLNLDSIPPNPDFHRESILDANSIKNAEFNKFELNKPLKNIYGKQFYFSLKYPGADSENTLAIFLYDNNSVQFNNVENVMKGKFFENGTFIQNKEMVFSISGNQSEYPVVYQFHTLKVIENKNVFPRAFLVNKFTTVDTGKAQDYLLQNPDFDLRHNVILEKQLPSNITTDLQSSILNGTNANITSYDANKVTIHTNVNAPSILILTDTYYPGWKAYVDGKETVIYRADGLVRSIYIPSGSHDIEFSYLPRSFVIGESISVTTAAILVGVLVYSKRKSSYMKENLA